MARLNMEVAAQDMWEAWGDDAQRIATENAAAHEKRGDAKGAEEWKAIAQACRIHLGPSPHPKRPYGKLRPRISPVRRSAPKVALGQLLLDV